MRRRFATCGFSLAPRSLAGRSFDFLCAPNSSSIRYADWRGRKIDGTTQRERHRWTHIAAEQIFKTQEPNLSSVDYLGILASDLEGDNGAMRIAFLWNELLAKADRKSHRLTSST